MAEPNASVGQAQADPSKGTTAAAPSATSGQSATPSQTTASGPANGAEETFLSAFDPKDLEGKPELKAAYTQMLRDYRSKTASIKESQKKLDEYDGFMKDPVASAQRYLQQLGYQVVQRNPEPGDQGKPWEPKSWAEVQDLIKQEAAAIANKQLNPMLKEVSNLKQQSIEARLDADYPDWHAYEDTMVKVLQAHPTLANDLDRLYRMSVPQEVIESRAYKKAMDKLKAGSDSATVSGAKTTSTQTSKRPEGKLTIDQAWQHAIRAVGVPS